MARRWSARVVSLDGEQVAIELIALHDAAGPPDVTASFALSLVPEHWHRVVRQVDPTRTFAENLRRAKADPRLLQLHDLAFGRELEVDRETYQRARLDRSYEGRPLLSSGMDGGRWTLKVQADRDRYEERAREIVRDVRATDALFAEAYERWPDDPALRPRVTLRFTIDPALVAFLRAEMSWETTAYR
jgi:hypothetical protein